MKLFLLRHGEAGSHARDFDRELTTRGLEQTRSVLARCADAGVSPARIWTSPLIRARQTAAEAESLWELKAEIQPFITPDDDPQKVLAALGALEANHPPLLIVSHMPLLGLLSGLLLDGVRGNRPLQTSQLVAMDMHFAIADGAELIGTWIPE
ncbi:MAG: phosphohistidine phosphatase SixA [Gammaproteobacteria bacterium]|nr:phosphohistidine phosphatase SixA [Gammaproteobacteria bacterium]